MSFSCTFRVQQSMKNCANVSGSVFSSFPSRIYPPLRISIPTLVQNWFEKAMTLFSPMLLQPLAILLHSSLARSPMLLNSMGHRNLRKQLNPILLLPSLQIRLISNLLKPLNPSHKLFLILLFLNPLKPLNPSRNSSKIQPAWKIPKPPNRRHKRHRSYSQILRISNPLKPPNRSLCFSRSFFQIRRVLTIPKPPNPNPSFCSQQRNISKRSRNRPIPRELPKKARRRARFSPISARCRSNALRNHRVRLLHSVLLHPLSKQNQQTPPENDPRAMILPQSTRLLWADYRSLCSCNRLSSSSTFRKRQRNRRSLRPTSDPINLLQNRESERLESRRVAP